MGRATVSSHTDVVFSVRVPREIAEKIDALRLPTRTPRNSWVLEAILEKLNRVEEARRKHVIGENMED